MRSSGRKPRQPNPQIDSLQGCLDDLEWRRIAWHLTKLRIMTFNNGHRALLALGHVYGIVKAETVSDLQPDWHLEVIAHCPLEEVAFMQTTFDHYLGKEPETEDEGAIRAAMSAFHARRAEFHL